MNEYPMDRGVASYHNIGHPVCNSYCKGQKHADVGYAGPDLTLEDVIEFYRTYARLPIKDVKVELAHEAIIPDWVEATYKGQKAWAFLVSWEVVDGA